MKPKKYLNKQTFTYYFQISFQIAHVIREIRHFQQTPYKIEHIPKVKSYLLDQSLLLDDDEMYQRSLLIEPRSSRMSAPNTLAV
jgi:son of sevenless